MTSLSVVYISGTALSQFLGAAYSCSAGCKSVFRLYGMPHNVQETTDGELTSETRGVVLLGAAPLDFPLPPTGMQAVGYLMMCRAPAHRLSYADTKRLLCAADTQVSTPEVLMHITCEDRDSGTARVFYSVYELGAQTVVPLQLKVDNLVDSLEGFTKLSSTFSRNASAAAERPMSGSAEKERSSSRLLHAEYGDLEALAREKAALVRRIAELTSELLARERPGGL